MSKYQSVRGTRDLLPAQKKVFRHIESIAYGNALNYGFGQIETPIFEFSEVFHRAMGETSDAVSKETYTFADRGGDLITLRPEGTAGAVRAYVSEGLAQNNPNKLYYYGPMFRYERPQKGRYRQFYQFGVEILGLDNPLADVECIDLAYTILKKLNLESRCELQINTLGDVESRNSYREALVNFLTPIKDQLSEDSKVRLEKNPLRILDSKDENDKKLIANAPAMADFMTENTKIFFKSVLDGLTKLNIPFKVNPKLVRGLDYYCHTVFEFVTTELGAQGALLAGGRYDGLVETLGGAKTPGVGWASGVDRLAELCEKTLIIENKKPVSIITNSAETLELALVIASKLRNLDKYCEVFMNGNIGRKTEKAKKLNSYFCLQILSDQTNTSVNFGIFNFLNNIPIHNSIAKDRIFTKNVSGNIIVNEDIVNLDSIVQEVLKNINS